MSETTCKNCGREFFVNPNTVRDGNKSFAAYCYAVHEYYGCDTGCCGHKAYLCDKDGNILDEHFEFTHPYGEKDWAAVFLEGIWSGVTVDLEKCEIYDE